MPPIPPHDHQDNAQLPVIVIGAGPVGLAAAAHLREGGLSPLLLEAGHTPGAAVKAWGHTRLFSPWRYNIDDAARRLLEQTSWQAPDPDQLPTGHELVDEYLFPLARELGDTVRTDAHVMAVSRAGVDKTRSHTRANTPLLVRVQHGDGTVEDLRAHSVLDASGTWSQPNPLGHSGLLAPGEETAKANGLITTPLPDVLGTDHERFSNRRVLVVGSGHSAANTLLDLAELANNAPDTRIHWAVRGAEVSKVYGGEAHDELAARGALGTRLRRLVESGAIELHTQFRVTRFDTGTPTVTVHADTPAGVQRLRVDVVIAATGFRPELQMLSELRLELDPAVEAPRELGPMIDPEFHSCGSVEPHGERILAHPEPGFYIVGMKSYGRAPTFLMVTGYEQVRSIAAALAGDRAAADDVQLELPETGVCSANFGETVAVAASTSSQIRLVSQGCCSATQQAAPGAIPLHTTKCC